MEGEHDPVAPRVPLRRLLAALAVMGVTGLSGQMSYYHDDFVEKRHWLSHEEYLEGSILSNSVPGPIFVNFTVFATKRLNGWRAVPLGLILIVVPGSCAMLLLSILYSSGVAHSPLAAAGLGGLAAAAAALALVTLGRLLRARTVTASGLLIAGVTFVALAFLHLSILVVIPPLALIGLWFNRPKRGHCT